MANWSDLKAAVAEVIKTNDKQEITGKILQNTLNSIISNLGENATVAGIATPTTNPGVPDGPVFYLASQSGTYSNFNDITLTDDEVAFLLWKTSWTKLVTGLAKSSVIIDILSRFNLFSEIGYYYGNGSLNATDDKFINTGLIYIKGIDKITVTGDSGVYAINEISLFDNEKQYLGKKNFGSYTVSSLGENVAYIACSSLVTGNPKLEVNPIRQITGLSDMFNSINDSIEELNKGQEVSEENNSILHPFSFSKQGYYIDKGGYISDSKFVNTGFVFVKDAESITIQGDTGVFTATNKISLWDVNKKYLGKKEYGTYSQEELGENVIYVIGSSLATGNPTLELNSIKSIYSAIEGITEDVEELNKTNYNPSKGRSLYMEGASFASDNNGWFELASERLGLTPINKARGGTSIIDFANKIYNKTAWDEETFESFDILVIMHVHNQDVAKESVLSDSYTLPFDESSLDQYSQAYDYVIKEYSKQCYERRNVSTSRWYGTKMGKPVKIICCTHWHDARTIFNDSIRVLQKKWGFELCEFDKHIGFSKNAVNPATNAQWSLLYCDNDSANEETIGSVIYGWHPTGGQDAYIQKLMASIFVEAIKKINNDPNFTK